ncbi:hypothetical protein GGI05_002132 [Coemansia sp. RSA 2603]|nr:hypothetical protein GGI05_002132 [Coemansia sp. RSA 2603]
MTQRTHRVAICLVLRFPGASCALFILTPSAASPVLRCCNLPATRGSAITLCAIVPIYAELTSQPLTQRQRIRVMLLYLPTEHMVAIFRHCLSTDALVSSCYSVLSHLLRGMFNAIVLMFDLFQRSGIKPLLRTAGSIR